MTTVDSQADKALCHVDKLANIEVAEIPSDRGLPAGISPLESRVSGHTFDDERQTIGMLRGSDGRVFKPVVKPLLGKREITFYENLQVSQDPVMLQLKNYVPKYYGTTDLQVFGRQITFLMLKDITDGMAEPCVMDIKIGRRTWDPLATPEKRATEELKYAESKRTYGFCITGFQTYCASSGQLRKFGKHYGKTLDAKGVVEALFHKVVTSKFARATRYIPDGRRWKGKQETARRNGGCEGGKRIRAACGTPSRQRVWQREQTGATTSPTFLSVQYMHTLNTYNRLHIRVQAEQRKLGKGNEKETQRGQMRSPRMWPNASATRSPCRNISNAIFRSFLILVDLSVIEQRLLQLNPLFYNLEYYWLGYTSNVTNLGHICDTLIFYGLIPMERILNLRLNRIFNFGIILELPGDINRNNN
ncbi:inositol phosphate kinase 2 isoform X2 [Megachile rotundata]|uniref:inositol phosphate kinase 2 isoform X2 n=1 Tax=Megachile rotundata TaxID=143995 RepID=UPI003FD15EC6